MLTENERESFLIRLYFKTDKNFEDAGIKRAYLDFSRTLEIPENSSKEERDILRKNTQVFLKTELYNLISTEIKSQADFDQKHKQICEKLLNHWNELSFGQSQKWVNMSLKYWLLFGENRIRNIEKNAMFFHIPIDSIIQERFFQKGLAAWSKIDTYEKYFWYQEDFRKRNLNKIPILEEFREFNKVK